MRILFLLLILLNIAFFFWQSSQPGSPQSTAAEDPLPIEGAPKVLRLLHEDQTTKTGSAAEEETPRG